MIPSQSVPLLAILASPLTLTCPSLIKSTLYPNLVIFIFETSVEFVMNLLPLSTAIALVNSLVSSKLDYCNLLYSGISQTNLNKLQRIQNSLARVITNILQNINTSHQHSKTTLASYQTKNRLQNLSYHIQNTYKSTTYIYLQ